MKIVAAREITTDIKNEFRGIGEDVKYHMSEDVTIEHSRELLAEHVPSLVLGRAEMLLDTQLGYLMEDAIGALEETPTETKNKFYDLEMRDRLKKLFTLEPKTLQFSFDSRILTGGAAGGGAMLTGGVVTGILLSGLVSRVLAGLVTLVAAGAAFKLAHSAGENIARTKVENNVSEYLLQSERQVMDWLEEVEKEFVAAFDRFAAEHGVRQETQ